MIIATGWSKSWMALLESITQELKSITLSLISGGRPRSGERPNACVNLYLQNLVVQ